MLYDMTDGNLTKVASTTFKAEKVLERAHLQAAVRDHIDIIGEDLLVVAEDFGDFEDTHRRIDLLCVDRSAPSSSSNSRGPRLGGTWNYRPFGMPRWSP